MAVTLEIPPYLFKRRKVSKKDGGQVSLSCNSCDVYAYATQHFAEKKVTYTLSEFPNTHGCAPSSVQHLVAKFRQQLRYVIKQEPTRSVNDIVLSEMNIRDQCLKTVQLHSFKKFLPLRCLRTHKRVYPKAPTKKRIYPKAHIPKSAYTQKHYIKQVFG
jgi:hypothetical protein